MRIEEHPILGRTEKGKEVSFFYDGKPVTGFEGEPIAAALKAAGGWYTGIRKNTESPGVFFVPSGAARTVSWWWTAGPM